MQNPSLVRAFGGYLLGCLGAGVFLASFAAANIADHYNVNDDKRGPRQTLIATLMRYERYASCPFSTELNAYVCEENRPLVRQPGAKAAEVSRKAAVASFLGPWWERSFGLVAVVAGFVLVWRGFRPSRSQPPISSVSAPASAPVST